VTTRATPIPVGGCVARVPGAILDAAVAQAIAEAPLEACGLIIGSAPASAGGEARRYVPCRNALASRSRFSVHPDDLYRVTVDADDAGEVLWGIVHSHPHSPAVPSPTDRELALYPDALHVLVSLRDPAEPQVGAWRIVDGAADELALERV
jgi:[CysO sulfur-carrier protein]-S-L-cysteine hydrolase